MKTFLLSILLALSCAAATFQITTLRIGTLTAGTSGAFDCDAWQDFEFDTSGALMLDTDLESRDHASLDWSVVDTETNLTTHADGEYATISKPQGTADSGTRGLKYAASTTTASYARVNFSASGDVSAGFWFKGCDLATNDTPYVSRLYDAAANARMSVLWKDYDDTYTIYCAGSATSSEITAAKDTWYWVTFDYAKSGTCSLAMYNTSGAQVGSTVTFSDTGAADVTNLRFGMMYRATAQAATLYWDDCCLDTTDATFPLGP